MSRLIKADENKVISKQTLDYLRNNVIRYLQLNDFYHVIKHSPFLLTHRFKVFYGLICGLFRRVYGLTLSVYYSHSLHRGTCIYGKWPYFNTAS